MVFSSQSHSGFLAASQNLFARAINVNYKLGIQNKHENNLWVSNVEGNKIYSSSTCLEIIMRYFIHFLIHSVGCFVAKYEKIINFPERTKHFFYSADFFFIFRKKKSVPDFWDNLSKIAQKNVSCSARRWILVWEIWQHCKNIFYSANAKFWMNEFFFSPRLWHNSYYKLKQ